MTSLYNLRHIILHTYIDNERIYFHAKNTKTESDEIDWLDLIYTIEGIDIIISGPRLDSIITITLTI
jgi:hypothetical protein